MYSSSNEIEKNNNAYKEKTHMKNIFILIYFVLKLKFYFIFILNYECIIFYLEKTNKLN